MKAAMCREFGGRVFIENVPKPKLLPGTVRIRMAMAAVNPPDILMPQGKYQVRPPLPFAVGIEGAGVVIEVADDVASIRAGDRVMTYAGHGCFAEEVVVPAHLVYQIPDKMSFETAAGFSLVYGTAYHALIDRGELSKGESVAILGAAGGIGLCAIQIADAVGAQAIAVASTEEKLAVCRSNGAKAALKTTSPNLAQLLRECSAGTKGLSVVHDTVGGALTLTALRALKPFGRHLIVGYASGEIPLIPGNYVLLKQVDVRGVSFRQCAQDSPDVAHASIQTLLKMWNDGKLVPHISKIYAFDQMHEALDVLARGAAIGKHLIRIADL